MVVSKTLSASADLVQSVRAQRVSRALSPSPPDVSENAALSPSPSLAPVKSVRAQTLLAAQEASPPREGRRRAYVPPDAPRHAAREAPPSQDRAALRRETARRVAEQNQAADATNGQGESAVAPGVRNILPPLGPSPVNTPQDSRSIFPEPLNGANASSPASGVVKNAANHALASTLYRAANARLDIFGEGSTSNTTLASPASSPIDISV